MFSTPDTAPGEAGEAEPKSSTRRVLTKEQKADRDQQILELKREGLKNPEIGRCFNTSEGSIRKALDRVQKKEETTG